MGAGQVGTDGRVEIVHVERPTQCACGEPLRAGERAGLLPAEPSPVCLWCLADVQAGRPRPRRRHSVTEWPEQLALTSPGPSGAFAADHARDDWSAAPAHLQVIDGRASHRSSRRRRMARGGRPRTVVSLLLTAAIVGGALWGIPQLMGADRSSLPISGITWGTNGIDYSQPHPVVPGSVQGIRAMWPPVPVDARDEPLGRPPLSRSASTDYVFMQRTGGPTSAPVAWDPCRPIHIVVNSADAPPEADRLLAEGASEISRATGLQFVVEGPTDEPPSENRPAINGARYGNRWSPVLLAWTNPTVVPRLAGDVAGLGGPDGATYAKSVDQHWVSGLVYLDGPTFRAIMRRPDGWAQARAIVMHELGHLVGLTHVTNQHELMAARNDGRTTFGDGDLEGLRQLGVGRCFTS